MAGSYPSDTKGKQDGINPGTETSTDGLLKPFVENMWTAELTLWGMDVILLDAGRNSWLFHRPRDLVVHPVPWPKWPSLHMVRVTGIWCELVSWHRGGRNHTKFLCVSSALPLNCVSPIIPRKSRSQTLVGRMLLLRQRFNTCSLWYNLYLKYKLIAFF